MLCSAPFRQGVAEFRCGKCSPCLLNRKSLWSARLMLEAQLHEVSYFVTLTYDKEHLPCDMSVSILDAQLFLKRLRALVSPVKVRYFIVGEYGDVSQRPHYHAVLFGQITPAQVEASWKMGRVHVGMLTAASASYVVSYTTKRMTGVVDARLKGRRPEFARMSLRPGIGAGAMPDFAKALYSKGGSLHMALEGDVPGGFKFAGKMKPLGRYLKNRLRCAMGLSEGEPVSVADIRAAFQQALLMNPGAKEHLEDLRVRDGHRARGFITRANSKKEM